MRNLLCYPMTVAALALMASSVCAQEAEHYTAVSKTAMSVTGDVWLDDFGITFENEETLEFSDLVADNFRVNGRRVPASVYRVAQPADPELENGNQALRIGRRDLCRELGVVQGNVGDRRVYGEKSAKEQRRDVRSLHL